MNTKEEYITLKEFANKAGITTAAIHQSKKLKPYIRKNTKPQTISTKALNLYDITLVNDYVSLSKDVSIEKLTQNGKLNNELSRDNRNFTKENENLSNDKNYIEISKLNENITNQICKDIIKDEENLSKYEKNVGNSLQIEIKFLNKEIEILKETYERILQEKDNKYNDLKEESNKKDVQINNLSLSVKETNQKLIGIQLNNQTLERENNKLKLLAAEQQELKNPEAIKVQPNENKKPGFLKKLFRKEGVKK